MMTKPAFFIWTIAAPVLTGMLITVLLMIPSVAHTMGLWIIGAAVLSMIVTVPFSIAVGKAIT